MQKYVKDLENEHVYFIKVFANLDLMMKRELLRGDRIRGLVLGQHEKVHKGIRDYDLEIDTTTLSPFILAENILTFVQQNPFPKGFKSMKHKITLL